MSFIYSRLGVTITTLVSLGSAAAFMIHGGRVFRDETSFYADSVAGHARIVSSQLSSGRRTVGWKVDYEFTIASGADTVYRGPSRSYAQAINTQQKPGDTVSIRYRPNDPPQNALETGGPVLWYAYVMLGSGFLSLAIAVSFAAPWTGLRR